MWLNCRRKKKVYRGMRIRRFRMVKKDPRKEPVEFRTYWADRLAREAALA